MSVLHRFYCIRTNKAVHRYIFLFGMAREILVLIGSAINEDSDEHAHTHCPVRVFASRLLNVWRSIGYHAKNWDLSLTM